MTRLIPLLALTLCGCPEDKEDTGHWDPDAAICGRVIGGDSGCASSPLPETVSVHTIAEGTTVCADYDEYWYDTGYQDWHDTLVDEAVVDAEGYFSAHVDPGDYGLSTWIGPCEACEGVSVPYDVPTCTQVELVLSNPPEMDAPNVYLYPEVPTEVRVRLPGLARKITAVDPPYPQGWDVLAMPDGRLHTPWGERDYLFYELGHFSDFDHEEGWCVDGQFAVDDMASALEAMGFLPNEVADFVDFWDAAWTVRRPVTVYPQLHELLPLKIEPAPDHLARAWFVVEAGCAPGLTEPALPVFERSGYHAAEWGLAVMPPLPGANVVPLP
ncbi:MAG: hypothetical protein ABIO70_33330 [Pseudomonadota bacterium]